MAGWVLRPGGALLVAAVAVSSAVFALVSRRYAVPTVATSPVVLLAMLGCVVALARLHLTLGPGWVVWRHVLTWLSVLAAAYPGLWAVASVVSDRAPGERWAWAAAVVAGVAHLPIVAAFSVVPLVAVGYLGRGAPRWPLRVVVGLGVAAATAFALFFDDFDPLVADAPFASATGESLGAGVTAAFLATVLVGPLVALLSAWSAAAEAARRLALVGAAALAGAALVMLCGAIAATDLVPGAAALVLIGMYAALVVVCTGTTRALVVASDLVVAADPAPQDEAVLSRSDAAGPGEVLDPSCPTAPSASAALTAREGEVLALLAAGLSNAGIAARLVLSERTVDAHLRSVFTKLDLPEGPQQNRRVHAAMRWVGTTTRGGTSPG